MMINENDLAKTFKLLCGKSFVSVNVDDIAPHPYFEDYAFVRGTVKLVDTVLGFNVPVKLDQR